VGCIRRIDSLVDVPGADTSVRGMVRLRWAVRGGALQRGDNGFCVLGRVIFLSVLR